MRQTTFVLLFAALCAGGCAGSISVRGALPTGQATLAVLDFEDEAAFKGLRDLTLVGATGVPAPGRLFARIFGTELRRVGAATVRAEMKERGSVAGDAARARGRALGADAVVVGEVRAYKTTWALFVPWTTVEATAACLDVQTGDEVFAIRARRTRLFSIEEDVARSLCRDALSRLRAGGGR